jgi:flagellar M-ring protein FliF
VPIIDVERLKDQGKRFADGFTPGQKAMTIIGVVGVVLVGMFFMKWASTPDYVPLYTGLSGQDAAAVTQKLDSANVPYKLAGGGGTIMVPKNEVYKQRVALSAEGLPSGGGDSYALLDKQGITTDEFTRNVDYQRALQGELGRTIQSINGITAASVTIQIPHDTVFVGSEQEKATAAVLVKSNSDISTDTVAAIVHLVASSIPHMSPDDVTVADANGKVLHAPGTAVGAGSGAQLEAKQTYEDALQKKVSDLIAATLGPGHAAVTANAELDSSSQKSTATNYTNPAGNGTLPLKSNSDKTSLTEPAGNATQGIVGVGNNGNSTTGNNGTRSYTEDKNAQDNAVNSNVTNSETPPGTLKKLSMSVVLDSAAAQNPEDANSVAQLVSQWTPTIAAAAGIDPTRDGQNALQVTTTQFATDAIKKANTPAGGSSGSNPLFDLLKTVLVLAMIGLILFFAWRAIKKAEANRIPLRVPLDLRELEAPASVSLDALPVGAAAAVGAGRAAPKSLEPPPPTLEGEITDLIEQQPDEVAQTLRSWLADRRG